MTMNVFEPDASAAQFRAAVKNELVTINGNVNIIGFLASGDKASATYAHYTKLGCEDVGMRFEMIKADAESIENLLTMANSDSSVHGIFIYYPIFGDVRDAELRNKIAWQKDVEGLTSYWMKKLYANKRFEDIEQTRKAILPCTPLAIIKILEQIDVYKKLHAKDSTILPLSECKIAVFNRSEVVGKPLAYMLSNDGGYVYSFDVNSGFAIAPGGKTQALISRAEALAESDVVITGVPSRDFHKIRAIELKDGAICLNFSHTQNFADDAKQQARYYIPRVGTMTVAMCLRNALRLYRNYHIVG